MDRTSRGHTVILMYLFVWILGGCGVVSVLAYLREKEGLVVESWMALAMLTFWMIALPLLISMAIVESPQDAAEVDDDPDDKVDD